MTVLRCAKCGAEFDAHAYLLRHVRREHGPAAAMVTPEDIERDSDSEGVLEAALGDAVADVQDETFAGTAEAEAFEEGIDPNSGQVMDTHWRRTLREREHQWQATVRNRQRTLGDLLDPRDEYRCEQCGHVFPHREDLDRHRWIEHGPRRAAS
jgi:uncharacterized C2H2 Zn-finger protein